MNQVLQDVPTPMAATRTHLSTSAPPLVVFLGPPGSGKGTQCARLVELLGVAHVSTGDALRDEVQRGSRLGERASAYLRSGSLVPDSVVFEVLRNELQRHRHAPAVLLDGFPRTMAQALELHQVPNAVRLAIALVVPKDTLLRRLAERARADDQVEVVERRLLSYGRETRPLLRWYAARGTLVYVDGSRPPSEITAILARHLRRVVIGES